jgi:uncharacterized protein
MREEHIDAAAPEDWGFGLINVPAGTPIAIDARFESVMDGVLVTATIDVAVAAECGRCLDPVELRVDAPVQELFSYERDPEDDEALTVDGDVVDLEPVVRDAVVLALPINPLCEPDCPGLCATCGARMADVEPDHAHDEVDPRWAALALLKEPNDNPSTQSNNEET